MDLRRAVFLKKTLLESSINSLNGSSVSLYESAVEDSDNSIYYSFSDGSTKTIDIIEDENLENSFASEADKENTVIMKDITNEKVSKAQNTPTNKGPIIEMRNQTAEKVIVIHDDPVINVSDDSTLNETTDKMDVDAVLVEPEKEEENSMNIKSIEVEKMKSDTDKTIIPVIVVEDPNKNVINPFTMPSTSSSSTVDFMHHSTPEQASKTNDEFKKKSASKIPTRPHFYSSVQRKSLDRKAKINVKTPKLASKLQRRTVYETRSRLIDQPKPKSTIIDPVIQHLPKNATAPKTAAKIKPKPALYKCTFPGCNRDFRLLKTYQDHQKAHKEGASSSSLSTTSFKCKWCDKGFDKESALNGHTLEKCPKIPFNEKRKLIAQEEAKEKNVDKRKSVFVAPAPKKQSPTRRKTLNKSGITITPKKTLKCSQCLKLFTDVVEFANHTIGHKYEKINAQNKT